MTQALEAKIYLDWPTKKGPSNRVILEGLRKKEIEGGRLFLKEEDRELLNSEGDLPVAFFHLYEIYWAVRNKDGFDWTNLKSYCDLWELELSGEELTTLQYINLAVTNKVNELQKADMISDKPKENNGKGVANRPNKGRR